MLVKHLPFADYRDRRVLHGSPFLICFPAGTHCELYKDPCANISCLNGGTCDSEGLNGTCICAPGFTGERSMSVFSNSPHSPHLFPRPDNPKPSAMSNCKAGVLLRNVRRHGFSEIYFKTIDYVVIKLGASEASICWLDLLTLPSRHTCRVGAFMRTLGSVSVNVVWSGQEGSSVFCVNSIQTLFYFYWML